MGSPKKSTPNSSSPEVRLGAVNIEHPIQHVNSVLQLPRLNAWQANPVPCILGLQECAPVGFVTGNILRIAMTLEVLDVWGRVFGVSGFATLQSILLWARHGFSPPFARTGIAAQNA